MSVSQSVNSSPKSAERVLTQQSPSGTVSPTANFAPQAIASGASSGFAHTGTVSSGLASHASQASFNSPAKGAFSSFASRSSQGATVGGSNAAVSSVPTDPKERGWTMFKSGIKGPLKLVAGFTGQEISEKAMDACIDQIKPNVLRAYEQANFQDAYAQLIDDLSPLFKMLEIGAPLVEPKPNIQVDPEDAETVKADPKTAAPPKPSIQDLIKAAKADSKTSEGSAFLSQFGRFETAMKNPTIEQGLGCFLCALKSPLERGFKLIQSAQKSASVDTKENKEVKGADEVALKAKALPAHTTVSNPTATKSSSYYGTLTIYTGIPAFLGPVIHAVDGMIVKIFRIKPIDPVDAAWATFKKELRAQFSPLLLAGDKFGYITNAQIEEFLETLKPLFIASLQNPHEERSFGQFINAVERMAYVGRVVLTVLKMQKQLELVIEIQKLIVASRASLESEPGRTLMAEHHPLAFVNLYRERGLDHSLDVMVKLGTGYLLSTLRQSHTQGFHVARSTSRETQREAAWLEFRGHFKQALIHYIMAAEGIQWWTENRMVTLAQINENIDFLKPFILGLYEKPTLDESYAEFVKIIQDLTKGIPFNDVFHPMMEQSKTGAAHFSYLSSARSWGQLSMIALRASRVVFSQWRAGQALHLGDHPNKMLEHAVRHTITSIKHAFVCGYQKMPRNESRAQVAAPVESKSQAASKED